MYIIGTIDNPFEDDTVQEEELYGLQQEWQEAEEEEDDKEEGSETTGSN